ncbi:MAG TPA: hypothetical protein VH188_01260 [Chthoniobacterales bacterium]|jgi:hypothetical protein|nr:hypothetical protein [Chthoniobacterales bacterium]
MTLYNNTPTPAQYGISDGTSVDCGTLKPNETTELPYYDKKPKVTVKFVAVGKAQPNQYPPFSVTIPQSGKGTSVTIGLFQQ